MLVLIITVLGLAIISKAFMFEENDVCVSDDTTLTCVCKDGENITLTATVNFDIKWIRVDGCFVVDVPLGAIPHLQLEEIVFSNIYELNIRPFALVGVQTLHTLKIDNIKNFQVQPHGFVGLLNVENVIIKNVVSKQLVEGSFGGVSTIEHFEIENSHFGDVQSNAFIFTNITAISIVNCTFDHIETTAFLIHVAKDVTFVSSRIQNINNKSISLSYVESLSILNCQFDVLVSDSIETVNLRRFKFEDCKVSELETNAFALVDASEKISFSGNVIKFAEEYSLNFSTSNSTSENRDLYLCCNYFTCDCHLEWLWGDPKELPHPHHENILKTGYCIGNETQLSNLVILKNIKDGRCDSLINRNLVGDIDTKTDTPDKYNSKQTKPTASQGAGRNSASAFMISLEIITLMTTFFSFWNYANCVV